MDITLKTWQKRALYGALFFVAFVVALQRTFPYQALKERLVMEAARQGWQVRIDDIGPSGLTGFEAEGVTLENGANEAMKVPLERVGASVGRVQALLGRAAVSFDARAFEGRVKGQFVGTKQT